MNRPPLHPARAGQLPAPRTSDDSLQVLIEAIDSLSRQRTLTGSAIPPSGCTPWPASSPKPSSSCPKPSATPAIRNSPGPRSASSWAPAPPRQHAATAATHDQLDNDHPHNADVRASGTRNCVAQEPEVVTGHPGCRSSSEVIAGVSRRDGSLRASATPQEQEPPLIAASVVLRIVFPL
jgi:hypothetical protein